MTDGKFHYDQCVTPGFSGLVITHKNSYAAYFTEYFKDWMFEFQGRRCGYCGDYLGDNWRGNRNAHVEHVHNRRYGGIDIPPNLLYSCKSCNMEKGRKHFSVLYIKIAIRKAGISKMMPGKSAEKLIMMGLLNIAPLEKLHFEVLEWPHVKKPSETECEKYQDYKVLRKAEKEDI